MKGSIPISMSMGILTGIPMNRGSISIPTKDMNTLMKNMNIPMKDLSMIKVTTFTRRAMPPGIPMAMQQSPGRALNPAGSSV